MIHWIYILTGMAGGAVLVYLLQRIKNKPLPAGWVVEILFYDIWEKYDTFREDIHGLAKPLSIRGHIRRVGALRYNMHRDKTWTHRYQVTVSGLPENIIIFKEKMDLLFRRSQ